MRWSLYNHFASGTNAKEVARSIMEFKGIGYQGIILGYAKEIVLENPTEGGRLIDDDRYTPAEYRMVEDWKQGTIETLRMIGARDILSVKFVSYPKNPDIAMINSSISRITGAGPIAVDALKASEPMPKVIADAMHDICTKTQQQLSRLWLDAEQQALQPTLDEWTISLMRKYNCGDQPLVFNTIQAYLKGSRDNANRHIIQAAKEGWIVAIKLVRGAYIDNEIRSLIHDTKVDTDHSYNTIADMFISQKIPAGYEDLEFPRTALFLATHNADSTEKAIATYCKRSGAGLPTTATLECGQIQGMADELSCALLERYEEYTRDPHAGKVPPPGVFKYQIWGSISECMGYLYRRAVENRGAVERTEHMVVALKQELRRRIFG